MKKLLSTTMVFLMILIISCQKDINSTPEATTIDLENCRVTSICVTGKDAHKISYSYDNAGLISYMETQQLGLSDQRVYFKRDTEGKLISSDWFLGENNSFTLRERYTYTNGHLTHVDLFDGFDIYYGQRNISYNSSGLIAEINFNHDFNDVSYLKLFEYDAEDLLIKKLFRDYYVSMDPSIFTEDETRTMPQGTSVKSSENYLMDHGLPFEFFKQRPFSIATPGVGSTIVQIDKNGNSMPEATMTYKTVTNNSRDFTEKIELADVNGKVVQTITYRFENCK